MLIDMIVQMMHGYYAWFKMLEAKLCVLMVWLVMCLCMNKAITWLVIGYFCRHGVTIKSRV